MLPSKIDQMKASHETGSEANFGFGHALMPSCLGIASEGSIFQFSDAADIASLWKICDISVRIQRLHSLTRRRRCFIF